MTKSKYYVVWVGKKPGIYESWEECCEKVKGVVGASYKSFKTKEEAMMAVGSRQSAVSSRQKAVGSRQSAPTNKQTYRLTDLQTNRPTNQQTNKPVYPSISVDAACSGNPGIMEYRGVDTATGKQLFHQGPFPLGTNNIGEFLALVHGLAYLKKRGSNLPIYTDSKTARKWVKDIAVKTKLVQNKKSEVLFDLIDRAIKWLKENNYSNLILTWDTEHWGEIPADFGRK